MKPTNTTPGWFEWLAVNPHPAAVIKKVTAIRTELEGTMEGVQTSVGRHHQNRLDKAGNLQQFDDEWAKHGKAPPDDERAPLVHDLEVAKAAEDTARKAQSKVSGPLNAINRVSRNIERYIADRIRDDREASKASQPRGLGLLVSTPGDRGSHTGAEARHIKYRTLKVITPKLKGDPLATIERARDDIAKYGEDLQTVLSAPPSLEEALAHANAQLDRLGTIPLVEVGFVSGKPSIHFPIQVLHEAESRSPGVIPSVVDPLPLMVAVAGDRIRAQVEEAIRAHYADVEIAPDQENRKRLITEFKASILEAERVECAAIWAARDAGHYVTFRADADPRAVLGVDGPEPTTQRD